MQAPLAITLGDPAGVGPEIILKAWRSLRNTGPTFVVVGDHAVLSAFGDVPIATVNSPEQAQEIFADALPLIHIPLDASTQVGHPSPAAVGAVIQWIRRATELALAGKVSGIVTAPIAKAPLYAAGFQFPGHTEFLGDLTRQAPYEGARGPIMMLTAADLRTTLVTVHEPIAKVSAHLTRGAVVRAALVTAEALQRDFGIAAPRLAVAGVNPHAGEQGSIGLEERDIIAPAVAELRAMGLNVTGPHPADSLFPHEMRVRYDAAICMYHDQALIPVKMLDFWGGVNITLGLPIVRTSPDHGTAFDIAGKGLARPDSLIAAIHAAWAIAGHRAS